MTVTRHGRSVPEALVSEFSTRSRHIEVEKNRLIDAYIEKRAAVHGRLFRAGNPCNPAREAGAIPGGTHSDWRTRATRMLGQDATRWAQGVAVNPSAMLLRADEAPDVICDRAGSGR